ncbi:NAD(P)/FAD-dependent oxidoreductase [Miltoncostaea marina]|uniref:NAD(P)/FAD-dependent oxidoreductase n=1 Tax=Miltoncostaea marina TaxID=2843215 RepID=UPI001C3D65CB|nr:NAD(P)/FAD-dependent oxidoreductase [Miltoncostaea marina]
MDTTWDCIVVGAGAAGLSAALVLGRARRRTLVIDAGRQSNLPAHGVGGLLGHEGRPPAELYAMGRAELARLPSVEVRAGEVVDGAADAHGVSLRLAGGGGERARRAILATGMDYRPPALPGVAERWGHSVFHCPFCHGWEVRDRALGVLDRGASGARRALLLGMWSADVTLFADGPAELDDADASRLRAAGVAVEERTVVGLRGPGDALTGVALDGGDVVPCEGLMVPAPLHQRSPLAERLGLATSPPTAVVADGLAVGPLGRTTSPVVLAAGDVTGAMQSVAGAIAAGHAAAAGVVHSLVAEDHGLPEHP